MAPTNSPLQLSAPKVTLLDVAKVFLIIGTIGFGGGMAIIALIQDYVVVRRRWLELDEFTHGVALGQVMGAFAVNITIFVGYRVRGLKGAIVASVAFLAPSVTIVIVLTELYLKFHGVPSFQSALNGISPVVVALILSAAFQMGKNKIKSIESILLLITTILLVGVLKIQVIFVLLGAVVYAIAKLRLDSKGINNESS